MLLLKKVRENVRAWRQSRHDLRNRSGWDNPTNGHDLLAAMLEAKRRLRRPLP